MSSSKDTNSQDQPLQRLQVSRVSCRLKQLPQSLHTHIYLALKQKETYVQQNIISWTIIPVSISNWSICYKGLHSFRQGGFKTPIQHHRGRDGNPPPLIVKEIKNILHVLLSFQLKKAILIKEWFNCKTRMPGTVKCRPTVAYWVQIDGINIATELITRYYLNGTLIQCCFNARPMSATLAQH